MFLLLLLLLLYDTGIHYHDVITNVTYKHLLNLTKVYMECKRAC